jgi:hypothetical protein
MGFRRTGFLKPVAAREAAKKASEAGQEASKDGSEEGIDLTDRQAVSD